MGARADLYQGRLMHNQSLQQTKPPVTSPACAGAAPAVFAAEACCYARWKGAGLRECSKRRAFLVAICALAVSPSFGLAAAQTPSERCMVAQERAEAEAAQKRVEAELAVAKRKADLALRHYATTDNEVWLEPDRATTLVAFADTTASVQVASTDDSPSPWSGPPLVFVSLRDLADISFDLLRDDGDYLASYNFTNVPAGVYRLACEIDQYLRPKLVMSCRVQFREGETKIGTPRRVHWRRL